MHFDRNQILRPYARTQISCLKKMPDLPLDILGSFVRGRAGEIDFLFQGIELTPFKTI